MKYFNNIMALLLICCNSYAQMNTSATMENLYKSHEGKKAIHRLYDQKLDSLSIEYELRDINTTYGMIRVLVTGDTAKPPIILVHGSNGCAPIALETYRGLLQEFRVFAVDVLAQPNKSEGVRLSMKDDSYGKWMNEVIEGLQLTSVSMAGFSLGGLVILKTLEYNESKIKEVYLTAPAYIVNGNPIKALLKVFLPMKRYMKTQNQKYVEKFLSAIFSERDEFAMNYLSQVFLEFEMDFTPLPVIDKEKAKAIKTPIHLYAAEDDVIFPGKKMIKRASKIFPSLANSLLLIDSKHVQNKQDNIRICQEITGK